MKKNNHLINRKNGFSILTVILVIVTVIVVIGVWALSGQSNTTNDTSSQVLVGTIMNDANNVKVEFNNRVINGENPMNLGVGLPNIFDPTTGMPYPLDSSKAVYPEILQYIGAPVWRLSNLLLAGSPNPKQIVSLAGVKDSICKQVNQLYNGNSYILELVSSQVTMADGISRILQTNIPSDQKVGCYHDANSSLGPSYPPVYFFFMVM